MVALPGVAVPLGIGRLVGVEHSVTLSFVLTLAVVLLVYEWTHYVIHSDYKPRTTSGTSDRLLGTYPDPATVPTSPTAKDLHGGQRRVGSP